eukprot:RCo026103
MTNPSSSTPQCFKTRWNLGAHTQRPPLVINHAEMMHLNAPSRLSHPESTAKNQKVDHISPIVSILSWSGTASMTLCNRVASLSPGFRCKYFSSSREAPATSPLRYAVKAAMYSA